MKKYFLFAILLALFISPAISSAQIRPVAPAPTPIEMPAGNILEICIKGPEVSLTVSAKNARALAVVVTEDGTQVFPVTPNTFFLQPMQTQLNIPVLYNNQTILEIGKIYEVYIDGKLAVTFRPISCGPNLPAVTNLQVEELSGKTTQPNIFARAFRWIEDLTQKIIAFFKFPKKSCTDAIGNSLPISALPSNVYNDNGICRCKEPVGSVYNSQTKQCITEKDERPTDTPSGNGTQKTQLNLTVGTYPPADIYTLEVHVRDAQGNQVGVPCIRPGSDQVGQSGPNPKICNYGFSPNQMVYFYPQPVKEYWDSASQSLMPTTSFVGSWIKDSVNCSSPTLATDAADCPLINMGPGGSVQNVTIDLRSQ